jgi:soluble lytic murein transglycosylase-like protein
MIMILVMLASATARPSSTLEPLIAEASTRTGLPAKWIASVIATESGGRTSGPDRPLRSVAGAMGVMQIMPKTWSDMAGSQGFRLDPDRPRDNVLVGSAYLLSLYQRFGFPGAVAAYHAGPGTYGRYLDGRRALPAATRSYVATVQGRLGEPRHDPGPSAGAVSHSFSQLFVPIGASRTIRAEHLADHVDGLFVSHPDATAMP